MASGQRAPASAEWIRGREAGAKDGAFDRRRDRVAEGDEISLVDIVLGSLMGRLCTWAVYPPSIHFVTDGIVSHYHGVAGLALLRLLVHSHLQAICAYIHASTTT
jgi:hypothetical protein